MQFSPAGCKAAGTHPVYPGAPQRCASPAPPRHRADHATTTPPATPATASTSGPRAGQRKGVTCGR